MQPLRHQARTVRRADQLSDDDPDNLTADDKKLVFTYDYLNRRVRKVVYAWDPEEGESGDWSATAELDLRYIYYEHLLLELDGLATIDRRRSVTTVKNTVAPGASIRRYSGVPTLS